jgi:ribonuclease HII
MKTKPSFKEENFYWNYNISHVMGLDEVGRGAFAGPIVAAGVIYKPFSKYDYFDKVKDSKLLSHKKRETLSTLIKESSIWTIEEIEVDFINKFGIGKANYEVLKKVIKKLEEKINGENYFAIVDGYDLRIKKQKGIVRGDSISLSIASASIIAKEYRDDLMIKYSKLFPQYKFSENKGYGTQFHRDVIKNQGLCRIHRTSFNIVL